jgi:hypothetical protein
VHIGNYQEFFILYADDELSDSVKAEVQQFIYDHPELQAEVEALEQAKLIPEKVVFPGKEKLYWHEKGRRPLVMNWRKYAAAAAVLLVAGSVWIMNQPAKEITHVVAEVKKVPNTSSPLNEKASADAEKKEQETSKPHQISARDKRKTSWQPAGHITTVTSLPNTAIVQQTTNMQKIEVKTDRSTREKPVILVPQPDLALINDVHPEVKNNTGFAKLETADEPVKIIDGVMENDDAVSFSENNSSSVYLANIPVDNPSLKPLLRKASRFINRVAALKSGTRPGVAFKNVEIAIQ